MERTHPTPDEQLNTNLTGTWVEYHGSQTAWYGHHLIVTERQVTEHGPRYGLATRTGRQVLDRVRPASVTVLQPGIASTWTARLAAIRAEADKYGEQYARTLVPFLHAVRSMVERNLFARAQRAVLDLEAAVLLIDEHTYRARVAELHATHGPRLQDSA